MAEAKLHLKAFREARSICQQLQLSHLAKKLPNTTNDLMLYLRVLTIMARIAHLEGRLKYAPVLWEDVSDRGAKLGWKEDGFTSMICMYSIADIYLKMGEVAEAIYLKAKADAMFKTGESRRH